MPSSIASCTRSTAISSTSGSAAAVSTVNFPLPQPISTRSSFASGISARHLPRKAFASRSQIAEHASMRGSKLFRFLILIGTVPRFVSSFAENYTK